MLEIFGAAVVAARGRASPGGGNDFRTYRYTKKELPSLFREKEKAHLTRDVRGRIHSQFPERMRRSHRPLRNTVRHAWGT